MTETGDGRVGRGGESWSAGTESPAAVPGLRLSEFDEGFLVGVLVGEGHFGGDARQPQITLRMHIDHAALFEWLTEHVPGGRLYGPYDHSGRRYYQWMARGPVLREQLVPLLDRCLRPEHSGRAHERYQRMKDRYHLASAPPRPQTPPGS